MSLDQSETFREYTEKWPSLALEEAAAALFKKEGVVMTVAILTYLVNKAVEGEAVRAVQVLVIGCLALYGMIALFLLYIGWWMLRERNRPEFFVYEKKKKQGK